MAIQAVSGMSNLSSLYGGNSKINTNEFASKLLKKLDTDSNSTIEQSEASNISSDIFSKIDINGDGHITEDEIAENMQKGASLLKSLASQSSMNAFNIQNMTGEDMASSLISRYDTDSSQTLSLSEAGQAALSDELFSKIDTDANGEISQKELGSVFDTIKYKATAPEDVTGERSAKHDENSYKYTADDISSLMAQMSSTTSNKSIYNSTMDMFMQQAQSA